MPSLRCQQGTQSTGTDAEHTGPDQAAPQRGPRAQRGNAEMQERLGAGLETGGQEGGDQGGSGSGAGYASAGGGGMGDTGGSRPQGWGAALASHRGVTAFSNGGDSSYCDPGTYGYRYQCVEYVNRFAVEALGLRNMRGTGNAKDYAGGGRSGLSWIPNAPGAALPEDGDILVFSGGTYGHVAVCTGSSAGSVNMIQQNTRSATGSLGVQGSEGARSVKPWGSYPILGWQHPGKVSPQPTGGSSGSSTGSSTGSGDIRHTVQRGETLWGIANRYYGDGDRYMEIARANHLKNPSAINTGQVLTIPGTAKAAPKPETPAPVQTAPTAAAPTVAAPTVAAPATGADTKAIDQAALDQKAAQGKAAGDRLQQDLGQVGSLAQFNRVAGGFLGALAPGEGNQTSGKVSLEFKLAKAVDFAVELDFKVSRADGALKLETALSFKIAKVFPLLFAELKVGAYIKGALKAQGDSGQEIMDMISLAMLPKFQAVSDRLADAVYGDSSAFTDRVRQGMDADDPADGNRGDWVRTSLEGGAFAGFDTAGKDAPKGEMSIGYKTSDTMARNSAGQISRSAKSGLTLAQSFEAGGWKFGFRFDEVEDEAVLSTSGPLPVKAGNEAAAQALLGLLNQVVAVIGLCIGSLNKTGDAKARSLGIALGMIRNKITASAATIAASFKPGAVSISLDIELTLSMTGKGEFAITAAHVVEDKEGAFKGELRSGQKIAAIGFGA